MSHGHDEISNVMLKSLRSSIVFPLCHIFNHSIMEGLFPEHMRWVEVIPLYKGKSMDAMINYHPISPLITLFKILEKIMYTRLYSFLESKHILYSSQYGFHSKCSCEQAVTELIDYILQSKNHNEHSASVYLDLLKAFDTLDHAILLKKLDCYGIRSIAKDWLENYLNDRSLRTKIFGSVYRQQPNLADSSKPPHRKTEHKQMTTVTGEKSTGQSQSQECILWSHSFTPDIWYCSLGKHDTIIATKQNKNIQNQCVHIRNQSKNNSSLDG